MRKRIFGRRFKRDRNERKALFRSLMHALVLNGKIRTTEAKAKSIKGEIEKLVTIARSKGEEGKRILMARLVNEKVVDKLISEIAPLFVSRPGGYTRILKVGARGRDGAKMVMLTFVEEVSKTSVRPEKRDKTKKTPKIKETKKVKKEEKQKKTNSKKSR